MLARNGTQIVLCLRVRACMQVCVWWVTDVYIPPLPPLDNIHMGAVALSMVLEKYVSSQHFVFVWESRTTHFRWALRFNFVNTWVIGTDFILSKFVHNPHFDMCRKMCDKNRYITSKVCVHFQFLNTCSSLLYPYPGAPHTTSVMYDMYLPAIHQ